MEKDKDMDRAAGEAAEELKEERTETGAEQEAGAASEETPEAAGEASAKETEEAPAEEAGAQAEAPEDGSEDASSRPDKKDLQLKEANDRYLRLFAEFDNFRRRTEAEKAGMFTEGEKTVLLKILPLIDNFERALSSISGEEKAAPFAEGIDKVYRSFTDQLKELGVTPIEAVGSAFDANLHNAVMHVEDEEAGENMVVDEFQKGYMFHDKVLRYSMVKVAN